MKKIASLTLVLFLGASASYGQSGLRVFGAQQFQLDDNIAGNPKGYLSLNNGSIGIDGSGVVNGTFPNASALLTLLAGSKTTNLRVDGGSTWGIDVVNTNNSVRTSGRSMLGDGSGADDATFNIGTGNIIINTLPAPALPAPLSNVVYMNGSNQMNMTPGGVNIVTGSGTTNTLPLWTPNGFQLGNSYIKQSTNVAGGTLTSSERTVINSTVNGVNTLTVNNADNTSTGLKINANGGIGINVDPASTGIQIDATTLGIDLGTGATKPATGMNIQAKGTGESITVNGLTSGNVGSQVNVSGANGTGNVGFRATLSSGGGSGSWNRGIELNISGNGATGISAGIQNTGTVNPTFGGSFSVTGGGFSNTTGLSADVNGVNFGTARGLWIFTNSAAGSTNIGAELNVSGAGSTGLLVSGTPTNAISVATGNVVLGSTVNTIASGGTIPDGQAIVDVNDNGVGASVATVTLPTSPTNGQVVYVTTEDPDGVKITVGLASVTISNAEVGRFMYINGAWRLEH
ncbi:MAG: hypothetical protein JSS75_02075 [Bacteroidetes bacterium]|nr:hypothetical protein [Bacteroidota bacterium]